MAMKSGAVLVPTAGARTRMNRDAMYAMHVAGRDVQRGVLVELVEILNRGADRGGGDHRGGG